MLTAEEILLDELFSICDRASKFNDIANCGPSIYEFTEKFGKNPLLQSVRSSLIEDSNRDCEEITPVLKETTNLFWPIFDATIEVIESKKVILPSSIYKQEIFKNRTTLTLSLFDAQCIMFNNIINCFLESNNPELLEFLKKHAQIQYNNEQKAVVAIFQINRNRLNAELDNFNRLLVTREWFKYDRLADFHTIYNRKAFLERTEILKKLGHYSYCNDLTILSNIFDQATNPRIDPRMRSQNFVPNILNIYVDYMYSLCYYAQGKLFLAQTKSQGTSLAARKKIFKLRWDSQNMILTINGKKIERGLIAEKGPVLLLNFISKKWDSLKSLDLRCIYNIATGSSEKSLDGDQVTTARAHLRELNDIFTGEKERYPKILQLKNKVATPNLCYKFE